MDSKEVGVVRFQGVWSIPLSLGEEEILHGLEEFGCQGHLQIINQYGSH